jgi:hypothetical protein
MLKKWEIQTCIANGRNITKNYLVSKVTMDVIVIGCNCNGSKCMKSDKLPRNVNLSLKIYKNELQL